MKDVFVLKKNAWHSKLIKWVYGFDHTDFTHMCPYFWLNALTILILPLIIVFFILRKIIISIVSQINKAFDRIIEKEEEKLRLLSDDELKKYFSKKSYIRKYLFDRLPYDKYKIVNHFFHDKEKLKLENKKTNKEKINKIIKYTKPFTKIIIYLFAVSTIGLILYFFYWLFHNVEWGKINLWNSLINIGLFLLIILISIIFVYVITTIFKSKIMCKIGNGILSFFKLIIQMFKDSCPAIKWE